LNHSNQFIVGLALCALGNICTAEMARDLALEVEKLLHNNNSYIRKKAALCSLRIVRKVPDLIDYVMVPATSLLTDKHHGVLISGVKLCTELCQVSEVAVQHFRKHVMSLIRVLKSLVVSGYAPEYDVNGITDPFLQIRLLRLLGLLGKGDPETSDNMSDILAQVWSWWLFVHWGLIESSDMFACTHQHCLNTFILVSSCVQLLMCTSSLFFGTRNYLPGHSYLSSIIDHDCISFLDRLQQTQREARMLAMLSCMNAYRQSCP
jgi:hypothetical protein